MLTAPDGHRDPGELPLRLLLGFRVIIDALHSELAERGHPGVRPVHGFALQAIGSDGTSAVELARRLGVSKQAAGKTVAGLERLGYVERRLDARDARRKLLRLTPHGHDCLAVSGEVLSGLRREWAREIGVERLVALEHDLRRLTGGRRDPWRLDGPGWIG